MSKDKEKKIRNIFNCNKIKPKERSYGKLIFLCISYKYNITFVNIFKWIKFGLFRKRNGCHPNNISVIFSCLHNKVFIACKKNLTFVTSVTVRNALFYNKRTKRTFEHWTYERFEEIFIYVTRKLWAFFEGLIEYIKHVGRI